MPATPTAFVTTAQWIAWQRFGAISNKGVAFVQFTSAEPGQHRIQIQPAGGLFTDAFVTGDGVRFATIGGLLLNTAYAFRVRSENGGLSGWKTLAVDVPAMPNDPTDIDVPTDFAADVSVPRQVKFTWTDNATNESNYVIEIRGPEGFVQVLNTYGLADNPTVDVILPVRASFVLGKNLTFDTTYVARIKAQGGKFRTRNFTPINTDWSAEIEFTTAPEQIVITNLPANAQAWNGIAFAFQVETSVAALVTGGFSIETGTLPTGLSLDPDSGLINGTPNDEAGTYRVSIKAENGSGDDTAEIAIILATPSLRLTVGGLPLGFFALKGAITVPFNYAVSAIPYGPIDAATTWTIEQGPAWLTFVAGTLGGTPTESGAFVTVLTVGNGTQSTAATAEIDIRGVVFTTADHLTAYSGVAFVFNVGASPAGCVFTVGDLPEGVSFSGNTLSGTVATPGDYEIDIGAAFGDEGETQSFTLHILPLASLDSEWLWQKDQPQRETAVYNGPGDVMQWFLTGAPPGVTIETHIFSAGDMKHAIVTGAPTATGIYDAEVTAQVAIGSEVFLRRFPVRIEVSGGLFLGWFHRAAERRELQILVRSSQAAGYYFDAVDGMVLVRGDGAQIHIILRDAPIHEDQLGVRTIESGLTELRFIFRRMNDFDGEPYLNIGGTVATTVDDDTKDVPLVAIEDHVVPLLAFTPNSDALELDFNEINRAAGEDPTEMKITGMGEVTGVLNGKMFTTGIFKVTARQDAHR